MSNEYKERLFIRIGDLNIKEIDRDILAEDVFDVYFDGICTLRITNNDGKFSVTNAINRNGYSCFDEFKDDEVTFLTDLNEYTIFPKKSDRLIELQLKEICAALENLCKRRNDGDTGQLWTEFNDKFSAFKNKILKSSNGKGN